ncbi:hypothetical protein NLI96_g299 [Meripilus lineatus]|uniref:F-box domain-containing protein n=1 Tax=Meripilus lineatus TaxID=2056292 RepID=A0AAD5VI61_9APHY|nr:hypothetical protein NLI96_g299 [Physisporinus lineatus]
MRNETMLVKITPPPGPSLCYRTPRGDFPPELVREVAENLAGDFEALLTFSLLCHRWRNASRPILFTNVKIPRPQRLAEFVAIIDNDPSVAYYVRELMLGRQGNFETEWYQDIAPALGERLPNLTKLRILSLYFYTPAFEDLTAIKLETYQGLVSGFSRIETLQFTMSMLPPDILPKTLACAENLKTLIFDSCFPAGDATTEGKENEEADEAILKARSLGTSVHFGWPLVSCDHGANKASTLALHLLVEPMTSGPLKVISLTIPELQHSYWPLSTLEFIIYKHKQTLEELILEIPAPSTRTQLCSKLITVTILSPTSSSLIDLTNYQR